VYRGAVERKEVLAFLKDKSGLAQRTLLRQEDMAARKVASVRGVHFEAIHAEVAPASIGGSLKSWNGKSDEDFSDLSFECSVEEWPSSSLSMPSGDANDGANPGSKLEELGKRLASADRPVVVRGLAKDGFKWNLDSLLVAHGSQTNLQASPSSSFFCSPLYHLLFVVLSTRLVLTPTLLPFLTCCVTIAGGGERRRGEPRLSGPRRVDDVGRPRGRLAQRLFRGGLQLHASRQPRVLGSSQSRADSSLGSPEHGLLP